MKYLFIKTGLLATVTMLLCNSCKKDFLEIAPQGQLTEEQALIDPDAANKLVGGVYNSLYYQGTVGLKWLILSEVASDNSDKGSVAADNGFDGISLDPLTHTANTGIFNDVWNDHYKGIAYANKALDILNAGTYDSTTKKRLIGEVRFIRGLFYFNLVRVFGGVPKLLRTPLVSEANNDEFQIRASATDIYAAIVDDLMYGVNNLPQKGEAGSAVGRATKGAAQALLSKVYLYQKNWQAAYDMSQTVIISGKYDLATDYATIFREAGANNSESIFEVQTGPNKNGTACDGVSPNYSNFQGPRGSFPSSITVDGKTYVGGDLGFGLNTPTADLASAYEAGDVRRAATIIFTGPAIVKLWDSFPVPAQPAVVNDRYNYKGYHSPFKETNGCNGINDKDNKPKNIRIMRFAEVLLINAEAATYIGRDALTPLRRVRARASLTTTTTASEADIWKERRVELAEEGDRFFDLVRQGRAGVVMRAHGKAFVDNKNELFPIPQAQRDLSNGRLTQNPGY